MSPHSVFGHIIVVYATLPVLRTRILDRLVESTGSIFQDTSLNLCSCNSRKNDTFLPSEEATKGQSSERSFLKFSQNYTTFILKLATSLLANALAYFATGGVSAPLHNFQRRDDLVNGPF